MKKEKEEEKEEEFHDYGKDFANGMMKGALMVSLPHIVLDLIDKGDK